MHTAFVAAKTKLLSTLSVPMAREYLQKNQPEIARHHQSDGDSQLLVDVSVILRDDARSGIQRVVRALLKQLLTHPPQGYRVRPVFTTRQHGYRYVSNFLGRYSEQSVSEDNACPVTVDPGDVFLGLDLSAHLLPRRQAELAQWKRKGAALHIVVYDLIPVLHPEWFNPRTTRNFHRWLRTIAILADNLICISNSVKTELTDWLSCRYALAPNAIPIHTIPLGADIESSLPSEGIPSKIGPLWDALVSRPTVLMVGTLEPRKGHGQVLEAFEILWKRGCDTNMVIVGKPGWKTATLQRHLRERIQTERRLHWLDDASDEMLSFLYSTACGVIVASEAEGFGLPIIEAEHYHKPVLARDIAVFREIASDEVSFFSGTSGESLSESLDAWLARIKDGHTPVELKLRPGWQDCAEELIQRLGLAKGNTMNRKRGEILISDFPQELTV